METVPFDVNMYDDDEESLAKRIDGNRRPKKARVTGSRDDLFAERIRKGQGPRLRNRSASPQRLSNGDGRFGFDEEDMPFIPAPPVRTRSRANANAGKELLSSPAASARSFLRHASPAPKELFPVQTSTLGGPSNGGKELFANTSPHHRRTDAFDAADEAAVATGGSPPKPKPQSLADRITGGPPITMRRSSENHRDDALENPGFTIRGVAKEVNPRVRELFPEKDGGNSGKELFRSRRRAEDLF